MLSGKKNIEQEYFSSEEVKDLFLSDLQVLDLGVKEILLQDEIKILIDMKLASYAATTWGCDLTYDYVKINGDYRS